MKPLNTALIGFGLSGKVFHAPFLKENPFFNLTNIFSTRHNEIKQHYPEVIVTDKLEDVFTDNRIDLVVIGSPNTTHYPFAKEALLNGKHVVVEKPFVSEIEHGKELIELSGSKQKVLAVFQNRRWDGDFLTVKKIIDSGFLGEICEFESHFDRFRPIDDQLNWRSHQLPGSGVLYDLGPHLIDQALALFGLPDAVFGDIRISRESSCVDDTFELILYYKTLRVKLKASVMVKEPVPRFIIHGTKGSFVKYGLDPQEAELKVGAKPVGNDWGSDLDENFGILNTIRNGLDSRARVKTLNGNYMGFFNNLYHAITKGEPLEISAEEALLTIKIIHKAIESSTQKQVITL
jgi:scyllo-inositol 2-dehydrogenase (NADP+)